MSDQKPVSLKDCPTKQVLLEPPAIAPECPHGELQDYWTVGTYDGGMATLTRVHSPHQIIIHEEDVSSVTMGSNSKGKLCAKFQLTLSGMNEGLREIKESGPFSYHGFDVFLEARDLNGEGWVGKAKVKSRPYEFSNTGQRSGTYAQNQAFDALKKVIDGWTSGG